MDPFRGYYKLTAKRVIHIIHIILNCKCDGLSKQQAVLLQTENDQAVKLATDV